MRRSIVVAFAAIVLLVAPVGAVSGLSINGTPAYGATISYTFNDGGKRVVAHSCFVAEGRLDIGGTLYWLNPELVQSALLAPGQPITLSGWDPTSPFAFCDAEVFRISHDGFTVGGQFFTQYPVPAS
jgi:hypothetical protein